MIHTPYQFITSLPLIMTSILVQVIEAVKAVTKAGEAANSSTVWILIGATIIEGVIIYYLFNRNITISKEKDEQYSNLVKEKDAISEKFINEQKEEISRLRTIQETLGKIRRAEGNN